MVNTLQYKGIKIYRDAFGRTQPITEHWHIGLSEPVRTQLLDKVVSWAKNNEATQVVITHQLHPGEASALGVDGVIKFGYNTYGIWKLYGSVSKKNPRDEPSKHAEDERKRIEKVMENIEKEQKKPRGLSLFENPRERSQKDIVRIIKVRGRTKIIYKDGEERYVNPRSRFKQLYQIKDSHGRVHSIVGGLKLAKSHAQRYADMFEETMRIEPYEWRG